MGSQVSKRYRKKNLVNFLFCLVLIVFVQVLSKIANKHVSHHVTPEMYPLLGSCLLEAIFSVLDSVASSLDVVGAWTDAYWYLAETLMVEEDRIIDNMMLQPNGWIGFKSFVVRKRIESESIVSVYLTPEDNQLPLPLFQPGQYITLKITMPNGSVTHRNYSLSDSPGKGYYRISVKRVVGGEVSQYVHDVLRSGDKVPISVPSGTFTLAKYLNTRLRNRKLLENKNYQMPLVLISAGIGCTPFVSMLGSIFDPSPDFADAAKSAMKPGSDALGSENDPKVNGTEELKVNGVESTNHLDKKDCAGLPAPWDPMSTAAVLTESARLATSIPIIYLRAVKNRRHDAFFSQVSQFSSVDTGCKVVNVYSQPRPVVDVRGKDFQESGHINEHTLKILIPDPKNTVFYICGPDHFTRTQYYNIVSIGGQAQNIFYERFAPGGFNEQLTSKPSF